MRANEFINEDVPAAGTDTEREVAQAIYMEGRCGVLAIAINQANPERYKLGYIYEYNVPGTQDVYLDPDEFDALDPEEQQQVKLETQSWALVHAYVVDQQTKEYIDARGRHNKVPDLNYELNLTRKNVFPATSKDIVDITVDMNWNDATEEWDMVKGIAAWNQLGLDNDIPKALDYAVKYLNIDPGPVSQSTPKKSNWMNPGDPLPPSSPNSDWVILGPYKNVLYRFSAANEQRASAMKDQWCKENNIDSDSNRFCRLKYDGEVRLGQPIKSRSVTEGWSQKYKKSINCSHPKGFSQRAHCAGKKKQNESTEMEMVCEICGLCETHGDHSQNNLDEACWDTHKQVGMKKKGNKMVPNCVPKNEQQEITMTENQDELARILELSTGVSATDRVELNEEFDLIESIIDRLADRNGVDAEAIWEDLDSLTDDELYVFAVTTPVMEDWQKANKRDRTDGMSQKAVNAYRRENPGSKLKTAVTTKPSKLKKGGKASKRRKSYCSRSRGQMKMHSISCAKTPDKAICKARRRWNC